MRGLIVLSLAALAGCASTGSAPSMSARPSTVRVVTGSGGMAQVSTMVGSGSAGISSPGSAAVSLQASPDRVWETLPAVYQAVALPVSRLDASARVVGNAGIKLRRRLGGVSLAKYLECGSTQGGPSAETYDVHLIVLSHVQPGPSGGTTVNTSTQATARPVSFAGDPVECSSTGALEARIADELRARLKG